MEDKIELRKQQKEQIIKKMREKGCRITKQRLRLIDTILENDCSSCKEIFYQTAAKNHKIGIATVYRMVNLLEEIGALQSKDSYKVVCPEGKDAKEQVCTVVMDDGTVYRLNDNRWNDVVSKGLKACGYLEGHQVLSISVRRQNRCLKGVNEKISQQEKKH